MSASREDAVRLLTDPEYRIGGRSGPMTRMDVDKIRAELVRLGADDGWDGVLLNEAITVVGAVWREYHSKALGRRNLFSPPPMRSLWVPSRLLLPDH